MWARLEIYYLDLGDPGLRHSFQPCEQAKRSDLLVGRDGIEPSTFRLSGEHSNH